MLTEVRRQVIAQMVRKVGYEHAQDMAQEIGMDVWSRLGRNPYCFDDPKGLAAFVARGVRQKMVDIERRARQQERTHSAYEQARAAGSQPWMDPAGKIAIEELAETLANAIAALPPRRRKIFCRVRESGLSHAAVASELGLSTVSVSKMIVRAHDDLRAALHKYWEEGV